MGTIREFRDRKRYQRFVGRQDEINFFTDLVRKHNPSYNILMLYGIGGIGKSTLIQLLIKRSTLSIKV